MNVTHADCNSVSQFHCENTGMLMKRYVFIEDKNEWLRFVVFGLSFPLKIVSECINNLRAKLT